MLQFKRISAGNYEAQSLAGDVLIQKTMGEGKHIDIKWWVSFPDGKTSYRRSYEAAKTWANKYIERLIINEKEDKKQSKTKIKAKVKEQTLKEKLAPNGAYVVGHDGIGCINSGTAACILHMVVNNKDFYLVGRELEVTDTLFNKYCFRIKFYLKEDPRPFTWECDNGKTIEVFDHFNKAEKAYRALDQKMIDVNNKSLDEIKSAKEQAKNGDMSGYFALADYGVI